jgi:hypothetical protein
LALHEELKLSGTEGLSRQWFGGPGSFFGRLHWFRWKYLRRRPFCWQVGEKLSLHELRKPVFERYLPFFL